MLFNEQVYRQIKTTDDGQMRKTNPTCSYLSTKCSGELKADGRIFYRKKIEKMPIQLVDDSYLRLSSLFVGQRANLFTFFVLISL